MKRLVYPLAFVFLFAAGCSDDDDPIKPATCATPCGPCQTCDTSGATPVCVKNCADGMTCEDGVCTAPVASTCDPACAACQMCDTTGATPTCVDICAANTTCEGGKCTPKADSKCDPACGDCEMCDLTVTPPACKSLCTGETECQNKACVAKAPADPCAGKCASCERCDTTHGVPMCVDACRPGTSCDSTKNVCRPLPAGSTFDHSTLTNFDSVTNDNAGALAVTAACLTCHKDAGEHLKASAHWLWKGPTPNLEGHKTGTDVGKKNLVNNFCVAIPSNEKRCTHCHAGYGWVNNTFDFNDTANMDCLACHAKTNYVKAPKTGGWPDYTSTKVTVDLKLAAQSVGSPSIGACGRCHFFAGGGDNVKKGDIGSPLGAAQLKAAADVHMGTYDDSGSVIANKKAFTCASCHGGTGHKIAGQGVHLPVAEGRLSCENCHGEAPHASNDALNNHAKDIACQTCHIPAFSRQKPTKMDWDWSTAGNKTTANIDPATGLVMKDFDGHQLPEYDAKKGNFIWKKNVRPAYAWFNGAVKRMTLDDAYPAGKGTQADPIDLGGPTATKADMDAKIFPFKIMKGRQPVDTTTRKVLSPNLFGPNGFWAKTPAAADYTAQKVEDLWTAVLTVGAKAAGQIGANDAYTGRATGAMPWDWAYTTMHMGINHEVAPKGKALGCSDCHNSNAGWDWTALGYTCDPMTGSADTCGSRHK